MDFRHSGFHRTGNRVPGIAFAFRRIPPITPTSNEPFHSNHDHPPNYTKIQAKIAGHCTQYSKKVLSLFSTFLPPTCYHRTLVLVHSLLILFLSLSICQFLRRLGWRASLLLHIHQRHLDCPSFFVAERWL